MSDAASNAEVNESSTRIVENVGQGLFRRLFGRASVSGATATQYTEVLAAGAALPDPVGYPMGWRIFVSDLGSAGAPAFRGLLSGTTPVWVDASGNIL